MAELKRIRMVIHQPRLNHVSETTITPDQLRAFEDHVRERIAHNRANPDERVPGVKQCRWCAVKATCKTLQDQVLGAFEAVEPATAESEELGAVLSQADLIEGWLKAIRAEAERRLFAGEPVEGFKLVQGKKGNRQWNDAKEAEATLKKMRLKVEEMYDLSLISPTTAEKLAKAKTLGPKQWATVQKLIVQREGKPSVAPASDKRDALVVGAAALDQFEDLTVSSTSL